MERVGWVSWQKVSSACQKSLLHDFMSKLPGHAALLYCRSDRSRLQTWSRADLSCTVSRWIMDSPSQAQAACLAQPFIPAGFAPVAPVLSYCKPWSSAVLSLLSKLAPGFCFEISIDGPRQTFGYLCTHVRICVSFHVWPSATGRANTTIIGAHEDV